MPHCLFFAQRAPPPPSHVEDITWMTRQGYIETRVPSDDVNAPHLRITSLTTTAIVKDIASASCHESTG